MDSLAHAFKTNASKALHDPALHRALSNIRRGFVQKRARARAALPEFDRLCDEARAIKDHTLTHLDLYLEEFERKVVEAGGRVHWADGAADACDMVLAICREAGAQTITKGKSMITEEIGLNDHLEAAGLKVVETDLGEYLIQLRGETPSHIIAPAIHLTRTEIEADFRRVHTDLPADRTLDEPADFVAEARAILRTAFLSADVGITGANLLVAETGSAVIVTNEGNGDLTATLPRVHITVASIEKMIPTLEDADTVLRVLARSATGQEMSTYTTFTTGPKRPEDPDGPGAWHVILLDNGRSELLGGSFRDILRCIRCGACMNHCPVYNAIGGHAYGWVYPGPVGAVLTPALIGIEEARDLPGASSLCGRCEAVCPMHIPLPDLMRRWREKAFSKGLPSLSERLALRLWAALARRPRLYRWAMHLAIGSLSALAGRRGAFRRLPLASGWTAYRDLPAPEGRTFLDLWQKSRAHRPDGTVGKEGTGRPGGAVGPGGAGR